MDVYYGSTADTENLVSSLTLDEGRGDDSKSVKTNSSLITSNEFEDNESDGKTSVFQTSMNMMKMCIGTGVLALPYATNEAGLLWYGVGLALVTLWNIYSTDRLLKCRKYMEEFKLRASTSVLLTRKQLFQRTSDVMVNFDEHLVVDAPYYDNNTSTFGKVALFAFGKFGLHFVDAIMIILMFGIVVAYEDAILEFIADTPVSSGVKYIDALVMLLILLPLASLTDFTLIAKISALGTSVIFLIFILIACYGIHENGFTGFTTASLSEQSLWPDGFSGFSSWYGVVAFGFGTVPFTFSIQESMEDTNQMMKATKASLWFVYAGYLLMGELLLIIFWPSLHGIQNDVISILPNDSSLSLLIKLSMIVVILSTVPVIIVPFGDLVQRKLGMGSESSNDSTKASEGTIIRISICIVCTLVSIFIPNFVYVISFLGCLCVSLISYAYPPLAHIICYDKVHRSSSSKSSSELQQLCLDGSILLVGIVSCIFTSYLTFQKMMEELRHM